MIFHIQINAYLQINAIKTNWLKKIVFQFEIAQLINIWNSLRPLQKHQQVQISDLLSLRHTEQYINQCRSDDERNILITFTCFKGDLLVICLWNIQHSLPTLAETENGNGVKVTCSVFITRLLHWRFFFFLMSL